MDQERKQTPESEDVYQTDEQIQTEADLEAQRWFEELLAATEAASEATVATPESQESSEEQEPQEAQNDQPEAASNPATAEQNQPETVDDWFQQLESPAESMQEIGTDEQAVAHHDMANMEDIELEKIILETMSEEWDISAIEQEIMSEPIESAFPEDDDLDLNVESPEEEETEEDEEEDDDLSKRKVRPRRRNDYGLFAIPHLVSTAIWVVICVTIGISLGRFLWICAADVLAFGRQNMDVTITITAEDDLDSITEKLHEAGLIKYPDLFKIYADLADVVEKGKISVGTFTLNTMYDYHAIVGGLSSTSSYRETTKVMIPEGYTCAQIFSLLEEKGVCTVAELEQYCMESEFSSYWFLENVEKGSKYCLEGFLFPDTYEFYTNSTAQQVFIKLLASFDHQFNEEMMNKINLLNDRLAEMYRKNGLSESYIESHRLGVREVIIIASMIEKETAYSGESPTISSVIYNRLTDPSNYPKLNIDATLIYVLGKNTLTKEDLAFDSPYNTYLYEGLPPTAISNPGIFSIKAALDPADTDYYFYALDPTAEITSHRFFKTYKEHEKFLESLGYGDE